MGNAKALFVAHNDEDYSHVHIVASKINPDTGRAYDLERSKIKLSDWALDYERERGGVINLRREDANGLRAAIRDRDAGRRSGRVDEAAFHLHRAAASPCAGKRDYPARPAWRGPRQRRTFAGAIS